MKRSLKYILLVFILTGPLMSLGQSWQSEEEEQRIAWINKHTNNKRIISISEFVKDLKLAAEKKEDYLLENCAIIYNSKEDKEYALSRTPGSYQMLFRYTKHIVINENISFSKGTSVTLSNCSYSFNEKYNSDFDIEIIFTNISFWNLNLINFASQGLTLDSINIGGKLDIQDNRLSGTICRIKNSNINHIHFSKSDSLFNEVEYGEGSSRIRLEENNRVSFCDISNIEQI